MDVLSGYSFELIALKTSRYFYFIQGTKKKLAFIDRSIPEKSLWFLMTSFVECG